MLTIIITLLLIIKPTVLVHGQGSGAAKLHSHVVIQIIGSADYRDRDWAEDQWQPLSVGLPVQSDWFIRPLGPSEVKILCADGGTTTTIREATAHPDCIDFQLEIDNMIPPNPRDGDKDSVQLLSPIGRIPDSTPDIRWQPATGYTKYQVSILSDGASIFGKTVEGVFYHLDNPDVLQRGNRYVIRVTPLDAFNDLQYALRDTSDIYVILDGEYNEVITRSNRLLEIISAANSDDVLTYTEAWTFFEFQLFNETANRLELILPQLPFAIEGNPTQLAASPYPYILAGDTYGGLGYGDHAQLYYEEARKLAQDIGDESIVALALERLGGD